MRLPVLGPRDVISALERGGEQVEALMGAVPRVLGLLDVAEVLLARASTAVDRVSVVADAAAAEVVRVGTIVDAAALEVKGVAAVVGRADVLVARVATLLDSLEPSLTKLQPTLETLADTTHPDEVAALVRLVDHLPALTEQVERDLLPVLTTLGSVAPDLHELLNVSRELNEILGKIPGVGRLKRRVEEEDDELAEPQTDELAAEPASGRKRPIR